MRQADSKMARMPQTQLDLIAQAILADDTKSLRIQLQAAASVNIRLPQRKNRPAGETPLMLAAERGSLSTVRLLITLGANLNETNEYRQPPLQYAVRGNSPGVVNLLLKSGADPNLVMADGEFVLREAATAAVDLRICRALLKHGADATMANKMGSTALHIAAFHGRADIVRPLIRAGADVNQRDRYGHGPLACSISRGRSDVSVHLLKHGADPVLQPEALGVAAWEGQLRIVELLIEKGWDIHSKAHQGRTPLQHARNRNHKSVINLLISAGAR